MKTESEARKPDGRRKLAHNNLDRWVTHIIQAVVARITSVIAAASTLVVTILLILGGLWLAYVYLPMNVFYIILAVLIADLALGIVLRAVVYDR